MSASEFYSKHAPDFSRTRFRIWPHVRQFVETLPPGALMLDIGCGNGKNMSLRSDIHTVGIERSSQLCKICTDEGLDVLNGSATALPFKDESFDAAIMIAVIHHLTPDEQIQALDEIQRILKKGGTCFLTNWAVEQPAESRRKFTKGLNMVIWKGKSETPLPYWVMDCEAAKEFAGSLPPSLHCESLAYEAGNWEFLIRKQ